MGEKDVDTLMKRLKKYSYSDKPVKQKLKNQSNIDKPGEIGELLKKQAEYHKMSLVEKLDFYENNIKNLKTELEEKNTHYNHFIEWEIIDPILLVLPRGIAFESYAYKNKRLEIKLHKPDYMDIDGKQTLLGGRSLFEDDYKQLLKDYPVVKEAISNLKRKGIKIFYKKEIRIGSKAA